MHDLTHTKIHARSYTHENTCMVLHTRKYMHGLTHTKIHARSYTHENTCTVLHTRKYMHGLTHLKIHARRKEAAPHMDYPYYNAEGRHNVENTHPI